MSLMMESERIGRTLTRIAHEVVLSDAQNDEPLADGGGDA